MSGDLSTVQAHLRPSALALDAGLNQVQAGRRTAGRPWSRNLVIGATLVSLWLAAALLAPLAPYPPEQVGVGAILEAPSLAHPFGVDNLGRDLFSRVLYGARIALWVALLGTAISALLGLSLGLLAGFYAGWLDQGLSRTMDVWMAFPGLLLAIIIVARLGPSLHNAVIALGIIGAPAFYRLMRSGALGLRRTDYVAAARATGANDRRIMARHVFPNLASSIVVLLTLRMGILILAGGSLSFIGLGAQPPTPEWGALLAAGRDYMDMAPWLAIAPGLCITLTVAGLNLLGDGLRDWLDPH
jgi:ABC-type dipeptide/oligopeptide/nickel transport system permease subunit